MKEEKAKKKEEKEKDKPLYAYYIELESIADLARQSFGSAHIKSFRDGKSYRMLSTGERIGKLRILYYIDSEKSGNFIVYEPWLESGERTEIKDTLMADSSDYKSFKLPIMEMLSNPYEKADDLKKAGKVMKVEIKDSNTLVKALAAYAREEDIMPKLYAFFSGKDHIIGTFELFHEGDARIFSYSKIPTNDKFSTLTYNYTNDVVKPANNFADKSIVYIRIINLKNAFPFF